MIRRILTWLTDRLPVREIRHQGAPYLERYYVATLCGWRVYLHHFIASDPDGLHDHPFRHSLSIILAGWYLEERRGGWRTRRWFNYVSGDCFHRVVVPAGSRGVWTLLVHSRRVKQWGFLLPAEQWISINGLGLNGALKLLGPASIYSPVAGGDRGHATWHLTAPKGRELRAQAELPAVFRSNRRAA